MGANKSLMIGKQKFSKEETTLLCRQNFCFMPMKRNRIPTIHAQATREEMKITKQAVRRHSVAQRAMKLGIEMFFGEKQEIVVDKRF